MTEASNFIPPRTLDVSDLPETSFDARAPVWWGNLLAIFIETTTIALLIVSYFYLRRNFGEWPPPRVNKEPILYHRDAAPQLLYGTINLVLIVGSCAIMIWTDLAARAKRANAVRLGLLVMFVVAAVATWLRYYEFHATHFRWNDNAYASIVWTILGTHVTYLLAAGAEFFIMFLWVLLHGLDERHPLDVTVAGVYWYWTAAVWVLCYLVVYVGARVL